MPWEKSFEMDDILEKAMQLFWEKGYQETSLSEILKETDLNKGSLYNAFGNKHALFLSVLARYKETQHDNHLEFFANFGSPDKTLQQFFTSLIETTIQDPDAKGCLLVNISAKMNQHEADVQQFVSNALGDVERFLQDQVNAGIKLGVFSNQINSTTLCKNLMAIIVSIRILGRGLYQREELYQVATEALRPLDIQL